MSDTAPAQNPSDPDQIREEIERTRADLAQTVNALSTKLDVKQQASQKANELKQTIVGATMRAKQAAPEPVQRSLDRAGTAVAPAVARAKPYRLHILAGVAGAGFVLVVLRRRTRNTRNTRESR